MLGLSKDPRCQYLQVFSYRLASFPRKKGTQFLPGTKVDRTGIWLVDLIWEANRDKGISFIIQQIHSFNSISPSSSSCLIPSFCCSRCFWICFMWTVCLNNGSLLSPAMMEEEWLTSNRSSRVGTAGLRQSFNQSSYSPTPLSYLLGILVVKFSVAPIGFLVCFTLCSTQTSTFLSC